LLCERIDFSHTRYTRVKPKNHYHYHYSWLWSIFSLQYWYFARQLRTQYVEGIYDNPVTLKSRLTVTQGHWKWNHWVDHTRLTVSRVIGRWILSWPWNVGQRSLSVIETGAIRKLRCGFLFAFYSNYMAVSVTVCEIFSVKEWRNLENQVSGRSRSLKMAPFDRPYATFCWSAIVSIALSCTIFEFFDVKYYRDPEVWVRCHSRSLKVVPFESLCTVFYSPAIVTMAVSLAISEIFSVKEWPDLEMWVSGHLRSLKMAPFGRQCMTFYYSAIVTIALSCTICELFDAE